MTRRGSLFDNDKAYPLTDDIEMSIYRRFNDLESLETPFPRRLRLCIHSEAPTASAL